MKKILITLMALALCIGLVGGAFAYFTDTETSSTNSFTAGTLTLDSDGITTTGPITIDCMAPGDITDELVFTIKNTGCINMGWVGNWEFSGGIGGPGNAYDLKDMLYIADAKMEFLTPTLSSEGWLDDSTPGYETGSYGMIDHFITNGVPSGPYGSYMGSVIGPNTLVSLNYWNDNTLMVPGSVYEHAGALTENYAYRLTIKFGFDPAADDNYQGIGPVTATLTINATQIVSAALQDLGVPAATADSWTAPTGWMNNQIADQTEP
jgi:predicted ribosomally synthesized peptide with SipW-like signal peptide